MGRLSSGRVFQQSGWAGRCCIRISSRFRGFARRIREGIMITLESIQLLNVGDRVCEAHIYVERLSNTHTAKPSFKCVVNRNEPVFKGSMGAYTATGAYRNVQYYR